MLGQDSVYQILRGNSINRLMQWKKLVTSVRYVMKPVRHIQSFRRNVEMYLVVITFSFISYFIGKNKALLYCRQWNKITFYPIRRELEIDISPLLVTLTSFWRFWFSKIHRKLSKIKNTVLQLAIIGHSQKYQLGWFLSTSLLQDVLRLNDQITTTLSSLYSSITWKYHS